MDNAEIPAAAPVVEPKVEAPLVAAPAPAPAPVVEAQAPPVISVEETLKRKREEEASGVMYEEPAPPAPRELASTSLIL